jgi:hypothetical protein
MVALGQLGVVSVAEVVEKFRVVIFLLVMNVDSEWVNVASAVVNGLRGKLYVTLLKSYISYFGKY